MSEPEFEGVFDEDYLYFYETFLAERTPEEVERIVELFELEPGTEILDCPCGHGRIANSLGERGFRVTGLDALHRPLVHRARASRLAGGDRVRERAYSRPRSRFQARYRRRPRLTTSLTFPPPGRTPPKPGFCEITRPRPMLFE